MKDPPVLFSGDYENAPTSTQFLREIKHQGGDGRRRAMEELYARYGPLVWRICKRARLPDSDAEDLTHNVVIRVMRFSTNFEKRRPGDTFRGWLTTIVNNEIRRHISRDGREAPLGEWAEDVVAEQESAEGELARGVYKAYRERLSLEFGPQLLDAFEHVVFHESTAKDAAEKCGVTANAVYIAKCRILKRLRELEPYFREALQNGDFDSTEPRA